MWFAVAMAVAAAQDDALRAENARLARGNEALQLLVMEARFRQGRSVRTAAMNPETTLRDVTEVYLRRHGLTEARLRDGAPLSPAERAKLGRLSDEVEAMMKRLAPGATPERFEASFDQHRPEARAVNRNARLKAEQQRLGRELMGLVMDSLPPGLRGR